MSDTKIKTGKKLWSEDDATCYLEDHEGLPQAWQRLFDETLDLRQAVSRECCVDSVAYLMSNGKVACSSYQGASEICECTNLEEAFSAGRVGCCDERCDLCRNPP